ncbi:diguanylate cyclase [Fulvimarina sp. 2208YS6-2-32]|uniref:Diguanylate cyclase n=1 Tax=Fulvimarina uroteuthidis TaxID=3098149 RepID=A0ABU5HX28_9HYPH|nr:diguanylate cyclase [Fulvimarina sp. 2208YS6-2-32]MDY8107585.1 diguanylate cyclase [Fulvimarina sp. 2208YS6-2-32]
MSPLEQSVDDALTHVVVLMLALMSVLFIAIISLSQYQTARAQHREAQLAKSTLDVRGDLIGGLAYDYSTWEDLVEKLVAGRDFDWADENVGKWVFDNNHFNVTAIVAPDGSTIYASVDGVRTDADVHTILEGGVDQLIAEFRDGAPGKTHSALLSDKGAPTIAAIAPITPTPDVKKPRSKYHLLIFAETLSGATLNQMGRDYLLPNLRRTGAAINAPNDGISIPLITASGETLGHLTWDGASPGITLLKFAIPIWAVLCIVFALLMKFFMRTVTLSAQRLRASQHRATHDSLTGLGNRALLDDFFELSALLEAGADAKPLSILYLDLDGFKQINDLHGHQAGDEVLRTIGARISAFVTRGDLAVRLGGDEFVLVLNAKWETDGIETVGRTIIESVERPIHVSGGASVSVGVTIGVSLAPHDGTTAETLLRQADDALRYGKALGKRQVFFYRNLPAEPGDRDSRPAGPRTEEPDVRSFPIAIAG